VTLRDELQAIYDEYGKLTAELVVEVARPAGHPLHDRVFDRSRKDAADAWYLHRAGELIRSVRVTYRNASGAKLDCRAFSPVRPQQAGVYDPLEVIAADPMLMHLLLARMEREWKDMRQRYEHLSEFWVMVREDVA
jgi:hypothetical protein